MILLAASAWAADLSLGVLGTVGSDLADATFADRTAHYPFGGGLLVPLRWSPRPGAALRVSLDLEALGGHDTVVWDTPSATYASTDHWSMAGVALLDVGGELEFVPSAVVTPYLGAGLAAGLVANFHSFGGDTEELLDPTQNDLDNPSNVDPYTVAGVPGATAWFGLRVGRSVALDLEAGYTVAFVPAEALQKSPEQLGAQRSAYALDVLRIGVGIAVPL